VFPFGVLVDSSLQSHWFIGVLFWWTIDSVRNVLEMYCVGSSYVLWGSYVGNAESFMWVYLVVSAKAKHHIQYFVRSLERIYAGQVWS
jgi:hypothetical protein